MAAPQGIRVVAAGSPAPDDAAPGSILSQLRERAARQRETKTLELAVGGEFGDQLVIVYGVLPTGELERYTDLAERMGNIALATDAAVAACRTVLWVADGDRTDLKVRLDAALWELLGWPLPDGIAEPDELLPREVVAGLFGGNGIAQLTHVERVLEWMQNPGASGAGEASAAT